MAKVKELVVPYALSVRAREALLLEAFYTSNRWILGEVIVDGTPNEFATHCITTLLERDPTLTLLEILLITLQSMHGIAGQTAVSELLGELPTLSIRDSRESVVRTAVQPPSPGRERPTLFVSYAAEDAEVARRLAEDLARYGHECQLERQAEQGSDGWLAATAEGLSNAYAVLLLAGVETWRDRWVQVELLAALDKRKQIVPLRLRNGRLPGFLPEGSEPLAFEEPDADTVQILLRRLPEAPSAATPSRWKAIPAALVQRADELIYMDRLKLAELRHVAQYTRLSGESQFQRTRGDKLVLPSVVARQELQHARWRRGVETPAEVRRFEDAVPELKQIRRAVLLGEPGAGKTTTLYKVAADLIDSALLDRAASVPLMVYLGQWTDAAESFSSFLRRSVGDLGAGLEARLGEGGAALLLDGLNEIPAGQQAQKYGQVDDFLQQEQIRKLMVFVSCREQDYPEERALALDRVTVSPLDAVQVHEFVHNYLDPVEGVEAGEDLFWKLAGEESEKSYRRFTDDVGQKLEAPFHTFWLAGALPEGISWWRWSGWRRNRAQPASLLRLAENPYMLFMLVDVYRASGRSLPANRGELFDSFVETLLLRERLFGIEQKRQSIVRTSAGEALLSSLTELAYEMQRQRATDGEEGSALTTLPLAAAGRFLDEEQRKQAASASLITLGDEVRFAHQLLQEYFAARAMGERIFAEKGAQPGLQAADIWLPSRWWEPTNWEEATILLDGLYSDDCSEVVRWAAGANPEVAARCIVESGAHTPEETKLAMQALWLPRLADVENDPDPRARAAVGRALGLVTLEDGQPLDKRRGVGFIVRDGARIPDIVWGKPLPAGTYTIGGDKGAYELDKRQVTLASETRLARYPVTYAQFQCFVEAADFGDARWWAGMPKKERVLGEQRFKFWNHPRERVSWYQAIAFCRWLSDKLGYAVDLPHEFEWEAAARYADGRFYPWGDEFDAARANTREGQRLGRTSPVGMYPYGANEALALYDLSGNVWEWCRNKVDEADEEWLDKDPVDRSGKMRVLRGGSWDFGRNFARAASRYDAYGPGFRDGNVGFRVLVRRPPSQNGH